MDIDVMQGRIQEEHLTDLINSFESVLKDALYKHVPAITKTLMTRKSNPWFTDEFRSQKRLFRKMEWTYCRSKMDAAWQNLKTQKQIYRDVFNKAETDALSNKVKECGRDTKKLYKIVNSILGTNKEKTPANHG